MNLVFLMYGKNDFFWFMNKTSVGTQIFYQFGIKNIEMKGNSIVINLFQKNK